MEDKYKIIISYIQDLSVEIASPEALVTIKNTIPDYKMTVGLKSKPLKKKNDRSFNNIKLRKSK